MMNRTPSFAQSPDDPYLWLEDVNGQRALEWVRARNAATVAELRQFPEYPALRQGILDILNSTKRIATPRIVGSFIYNFWQDAAHPRGIWRRVPVERYLVDDPDWETVLDIDALSAEEQENWAFAGASILRPGYDRCMIDLSRGGSDATESREFNLEAKRFVEGGFFVPASKGNVSWIDRNTLLVSSSAGEGMATASGYPVAVRQWTRGTSFADAPVVFRGEYEDVANQGYVLHTPERDYILVQRGITFYSSQTFVLDNNVFEQLDLPLDATFHGFVRGQMLVELKSEWNVGGRLHPQGALLSIDYERFRAGARDFSVVFQPDTRSSLSSVSTTAGLLLLGVLRNVRGELLQGRWTGTEWSLARVDLPVDGSIDVTDTDEYSDRYFFTYEGFLQPRTLYHIAGAAASPAAIKQMPSFFDSQGLVVRQHEAVSTDGERIPYFVVARKDIALDGSHPTNLTAYGGFEVPRTAYYAAVDGVTWLRYGGVYVLANIRGGGEFGPRWHQAALKEKRQVAFDDFIAVAEDLISRGYTSARHLGISGGSNGGLLVGVAFTQRPELFNAVACAVPLLDMRRYHTLLAGASWMAEYGNPDIPEEWKYIEKYSPYHNLAADKTYPKVFFMTTTHDDRVHPAHARKMAARMLEMGHACYYFENTEGGHGSGVTSEQRADMMALEAAYMLKMLR
ncbi:MAG: S9 family peptidase [Bacteroidetes bacterium]|nr:S9 family peptidase [Bacteroidota bacterium]